MIVASQAFVFYIKVMRVVLLIFFSLTIINLPAQDKLDFGDTPATNKSPKYKSNNKDFKEKRPIEWVKNSPEGLLIGNPCMEELRSNMGFVYVVQTNNRSIYKTRMNGFDRFWHNLFAKLRITFRNGPFWKFKLKKKRKECREITSDFVG